MVDSMFGLSVVSPPQTLGHETVVTQVELTQRGTGILGGAKAVALFKVVIAVICTTAVPEICDAPLGNDG
jgi:hypothetical protein